MAGQQQLSLGERVSEALRREGRKAAALTFLVVLLGVLIVRIAMRNSDVATVASAASISLNASKAQGHSSGNSSTVEFRTWLGQPLEPIHRNLFAVNLDFYPRESVETATAAPGGGFWGELEKSVSVKADATKERQILVENLELQARQLKLETTMMGATPRAVVNGGMVQVGDIVAAGTGESRTTFRVLKIEPRRIIIEREGIKLEVPMKLRAASNE